MKEVNLKIPTIQISKNKNGKNYSAICFEGAMINHLIHHHEIEWAVWDYLSKGYKVQLDVDSLKNKLS